MIKALRSASTSYLTENVLEELCSLSNMKKIVLKLAIEDENKRRAMMIAAGCEGVQSVAVDMRERKMTVIGEADPASITTKLRKFVFTELLSVGPAEEEKYVGCKVAYKCAFPQARIGVSASLSDKSSFQPSFWTWRKRN